MTREQWKTEAIGRIDEALRYASMARNILYDARRALESSGHRSAGVVMRLPIDDLSQAMTALSRVKATAECVIISEEDTECRS